MQCPFSIFFTSIPRFCKIISAVWPLILALKNVEYVFIVRYCIATPEKFYVLLNLVTVRKNFRKRERLCLKSVTKAKM